MNTLDYALAALAVFLCLKVWKRSTAARGAPLPPGPKPLPIIGNLRDKPTDHEWLTYSEWKRQYGTRMLVKSGSLLLDCIDLRSYCLRPNVARRRNHY